MLKFNKFKLHFIELQLIKYACEIFHRLPEMQFSTGNNKMKILSLGS